MTIQLELRAEVMERLAAEARARGLALEQYAESLLQEALANRASSSGELSVEGLHGLLTALAEGAEKLPKLPTSAFTRESFYEGRF
jgi:hypothetical protein